jgi:glycosyltransferase involved in cell wall biosynthesis
MSSNPNTPGAAIAYIIGTYPRFTTTFIDREIRALRQRGVELSILSIRHPTSGEEAQQTPEIAQRTEYLLPVSWVWVLAVGCKWGISRPRTFFSLLGYVLTRPHPSFAARVKTLFHFAEGVLAAERLVGRGIAHLHAHFADRAAVVALVAARLLGISYSLFAHANDIYVTPVLLPEKLQHARFVATCTRYNQAHLTALAGSRLARPIELIYHGLELDRFQPPARRAAVPRRLLSIGQLREKKGHAYLVHACRKLRGRGYDFTCDIIGDGPEREALRALIEDLQLSEVVHLRGALPHREVMDYYGRATVFVLASVAASNADRDGIPNVFLEAMAMRLPVVGAQFSGIPELIQDGVNGLLTPPGDAEALAEVIARVWDNPALAERLAAQGRLTVEQRFDIERNIERLAELLKSHLLRPAVPDVGLAQPIGKLS